MELFSLPSNWKKLTDAALAAHLETIEHLRSAVTADGAEFNIHSPADGDNPSGVEVVESLGEAKQAIKAELAEREETAAADAARREAALAALSDPEPEPEPEPEAPAEDAATEELAAEEPDPETPAVEEPEAPAVEELAAAEEPDPEPEAPAADPEPAKPAVDPAQGLANMSARRTATEVPRPATTPDGPITGRMIVAPKQITNQSQFSVGDVLEDVDALAEHLTPQINSRPKQQYKGETPEYTTLITSEFNYGDGMLTEQDSAANFSMMDRAGQSWRDEQEVLVASGGPCAPLMPSYEFTTCYSPQRPVEAGLPVIGAPRGGIKFLNQVPLGGEAAAAITIKDAAAGALLPGAAGYVAKNCTRVACPTESELTVASISWCVTFDNLNFRVFPEQVRDMLRRVQIEFTKAKEIFYLNRLDALSGAVIDINAAQANTFGSGRSLFRDLVVAGHNYRKRNNMGRDAILDVWLPDVVEDSLAIDMVNDNDMNAVGSIMAGPSGNLTQVLAQRARMNVSFYYYDASVAGFPASAHDGAAGAWNQLPDTFRSYMYAPGSVVRLDGGQLDLGIVRDSTLNGQNDLQMFAEQWIELARPGCEIARHDHSANYTGVGPQDVVAPAHP